jgi:hypothetical protein
VLNDFTLALELMSSAIKSDTSINGMKINNSEYLLSQYADDSSFILDGGDDSFRKSLYILEKISECAGLKTNLEKTEAIWIGSKIFVYFLFQIYSCFVFSKKIIVNTK